MNWRPRTAPQVARQRQQLLQRAHEYFAQQDVLQVDTPRIGSSTVTSVHIDSFSTTGNQYLQTSPEYFMKRMLAAGYPDIYNIGPAFRHGELGRRHLPEFTMIEWYRHSYELTAIVQDTVALLCRVLSDLELQPTRHVDYDALFAECLQLDIDSATAADCAKRIDADAELAGAIGDDLDAWLDLLLTTAVVPQFPVDRLTVVQHYPINQAALARRCPSHPQRADRFEVFIGDLELANGYVELADAAEQRARFAADLAHRRALGKSEPAIDEKLLAALAFGMPQCAGVAVGFERLHMLAAGRADIRDVVAFAEDPE